MVTKYVNRPVPTPEPDERPSQFGRLLLSVQNEHAGEWRVVLEGSRQTCTRFEGILLGRSDATIAGVVTGKGSGWDARVVCRDVDECELRVRWTAPVVEEPEPGSASADYGSLPDSPGA